MYAGFGCKTVGELYTAICFFMGAAVLDNGIPVILPFRTVILELASFALDSGICAAME